MPVRVDKPSGNDADIDLALLRTVLAEAVDDPATLAGNDPNMTAALSVLRARHRGQGGTVDGDGGGHRRRPAGISDRRPVTRGSMGSSAVDRQVVRAIPVVTTRRRGGHEGPAVGETDLRTRGAGRWWASNALLAQHVSSSVVIDRDPDHHGPQCQPASPPGHRTGLSLPRCHHPRRKSPRVPLPGCTRRCHHPGQQRPRFWHPDVGADDSTPDDG